MKTTLSTLRNILPQIPIIGPIVSKTYLKILERRFNGSEQYWIDRYATGGNSGSGSYEELATFKAEFLNAFVAEHNIDTVIEYGCGDGNQLQMATYPRYIGFDVSPDALCLCRETFQSDTTKTFKLMTEYDQEQAALTLSLDVLYHLVEDSVFQAYMTRLFTSSTQFVIIYSSDSDSQNDIQAPHVKHRQFTTWVQTNMPQWHLIQHIPNKYPSAAHHSEGYQADFYVYQRTENAD
ncbi:MAG: hypothetical protein AAF629_25140 [Chloroflexota bacterium]